MMGILNNWADDSVFHKWSLIIVGSILFVACVKIFLRLFLSQFRKFAEKTEVVWDDILVGCLERLKHWVLLIWVFYFVTRLFSRATVSGKPVKVVLAFSLVIQLLSWTLFVLKYWRHEVLDQRISDNPSAAAAVGLAFRMVQGVAVIFILLMGLSNIGVDIGALLAGLGVGGIAVALAAQNVLGDLLASLSIVLDKPFVIGDSIATEDFKGTVENIGIKTTRIRSVSGEQVIVSNKYLLESRVKNFKRMEQRRLVRTFGLTYSTPDSVLEKIPVWIKEIVDSEPQARFELCRFVQFGTSSLNFELIFFVNQPDYSIAMQVQEQILLKIMKKFKLEKVEFAVSPSAPTTETIANNPV